MVCEKVTSDEAESSFFAVQFKRELARLKKYFDLGRHCTSVAKTYLSGVYKKLSVVTAKVGDLKLTNASLREVSGTSSLTHPEMKLGLAKDLGEAHHQLEQKAGECRAFVAKVGKHEVELLIVRDFF